MCEKKLSVAPAGALTRMLVEATYPIVVKMDDCGTQDSVTFAPFPPFLPAPDKGSPGLKLPPLNKRLMGRSLSNGEIIAADLMKTLEENGTSLQIRSVLTCKALESTVTARSAKSVTVWDLSRMDYPEIGAPVGIWASQSIGERGTQLSMRTFHTAEGRGRSHNGWLQFMRRLFGCTRLNPLMYKVLNSSSSKWSPGQEITVGSICVPWCGERPCPLSGPSTNRSDVSHTTCESRHELGGGRGTDRSCLRRIPHLWRSHR
jgi:hypothetical protein